MTRLSFAPHEIVAAFREHTRPPRQDQIDALAAKWIAGWALAGAPGSGEYGIGFARIERQDGSRFEFTDDGEPVLCVIALGPECEPVDIVAHGRAGLASWLGRAAVLGEQHVMGPRLGDPLTIFPTLMDWLRGDRQGVVLIDKPRAAYELRDFGPFLAMGGLEHAAQLVALLTAPLPKVLVPVEEGERRAA